MTKEEREQVAAYIQYQLRRRGLSQKDLAQDFGCSQAAVSGVIQNRPEHSGLVSIRKYIASRLGRESWQELSAEAQEEVGA